MTKMRTFELEKLVHDEIVQGHIDEGGIVDFEVLDEARWIQELQKKIIEEQAELEAAETDEEKAKERQDIDNILYALGQLSTPDFVPTKTFNKRHYIHSVTMPADNYWSDYYAADPARFPELPVDV